jgi:hypothetical protein
MISRIFAQDCARIRARFALSHPARGQEVLTSSSTELREAMTRYAETTGGEVGGVFRNADAPEKAACPAATIA